ncbi:MAG: CpsD/CapB family tyrosine-protein kinase [Candidatus Dormibacteraceae bacterium]
MQVPLIAPPQPAFEPMIAAPLADASSTWDATRPLDLPGDLVDQCRQGYLKLVARARLGTGIVVGVTSALRREGRTSVALGLATAIAGDRQEPTLVLECDFEQPSLANLLGCEAASGLGEWLDGEAPLHSIRTLGSPGLFVIPAGNRRSDPARAMIQIDERQLLASLEGRFHNVVVDLPPVLGAAHSQLGMKLVPRILLVAREGLSRVAELEQAILQIGREQVAGVLVNGAESRTPGARRRR